MGAMTIKWLKRALLVLTVIALTLFAVRAYDSQRGPPLDLWHTHVPHELVADEIDRTNWAAYLAKENALFDLRKRERRPIATSREDRSILGTSSRTGTGRTSSNLPGRRRVRWCFFTVSPTLLIACATSRVSISNAAMSLSRFACLATERCRPDYPRWRGKIGPPPRALPYAKRGEESGRRVHCT